MWEQLAQVMTELAQDAQVRVVVVTGAGDKAFCAGADISEFSELRTEPSKARAYDATTHRACSALRHFPKPTIGRIRGSCIGGGMELALLCDIRLAALDSRFGVTPAKLGLGYSLEDTQLLVDRLGAPATREILFTGRIFAPEEALRLGIVNRVVAVDELDALVSQYTQDIANNAPLTLKASKAIVEQASKPRNEQDTKLCATLVAKCYASEDFAEGQAAFAQKRKPSFRGV